MTELEGQRLPGSVAFGTSMLPFFAPAEEIWSESVNAAEIRPGDLVTVRDPSRNLFTHRVVRIIRIAGQIAFVTKGDNRLKFDPLVLPSQWAGKVIQAGRKDLTSLGWCRLGRWLAWLSYLQAMAYHRFATSGFNRLRHSWVRKGWLPAWNFRIGWAVVSNPLAWAAESSTVESFKAGVLRQRFRWNGVRLRSWGTGDLEPMARIWNTVYPHHPMGSRRLHEKVCRSRWFDPSGCLMVEDRQGLLGWGFASLRDCAPGRKRNLGFMECLALTERGWQLGVGDLLFGELRRWLKRHGVGRILYGPVPVEGGPEKGVRYERPFQVAAGFGFQFFQWMSKFSVTREQYRRPTRRDALSGLKIRSWQPEDESFFRSFFGGPEYDPSRVQVHLAQGGSSEHVRVAVLKDRPVGLFQWVSEEEFGDYSRVGILWAAAELEEGVPKAYPFHLVVDGAYRGQGIGTVLAGETFEAIFRAGRESIHLWGSNEDLYRQFGFVAQEHFTVMQR